MVVLIFLLAAGSIPSASSALADAQSPLNLALFRAPQQKYSDQLVNLWVEKTWRHDGSRIPCVLESYRPGQRASTVLIYSHGSAENLLSCIPFLREAAQALKCDVVAWELSGYGLNEADKYERSSDGVNESLRSIVDFLTKTHGYEESQVILWGYDLCTGPTLQVASERKQLRGVVCFAAYTSIVNLLSDLTHPKVASMFDERWDNLASIRKVTCPVLLLHGQLDTLIRASHSEELKRACPAATLVILPKTGHDSFGWSEALRHVAVWLQNL